MSCGVKGAISAVDARSRRMTATPSSASRRSPTHPPRTARPNSAPGIAPAHLQPGIKRRDCPRWRVDPPVLIPLADSNDNRADLWLVIGYVERCDL